MAHCRDKDTSGGSFEVYSWHEPYWRPPFAHQDQEDSLNSLHSWNSSGQPTKRGRTQPHLLVDRPCKLFLNPQLHSQQTAWIALAHQRDKTHLQPSAGRKQLLPPAQASQFSSVQSLGRVRLFATPWTVSRQASLSITNPRVYSNSRPLSRWCHPTISSSVVACSSRLQSFSASGSFPMSQFFTLGCQSIGVSASASDIPMNIQDWSPLGRTGWISLQSKGLSKSLLQHHSSKASILQCSTFFIVQLSHPYMTTVKTIALTRRTFVGKVMPLLFNMLSRLVITFLPRSVSFSFMAAITIHSDFGAPKNKVCHCFHCFPIYFPWSDGTRCHDLSFLNVEL